MGMAGSDISRIRDGLFQNLLDLHYFSNLGHLGSSLSCLELLVHLFYKQIKGQDQFLLSKGHAASALYVVLNSVNKLGVSLDEFHRDGGRLPCHPSSSGHPSIPFGTGSLGHGASLSAGLALSAKLSKIDRHIYCLLSDGDLNEGSTWEALNFAAHHKLSNLVMILDQNGFQGFGASDQVLRFPALKERLSLMSYHVIEIANGNSLPEVARAFSEIHFQNQPTFIIAKTVKGHGLSFMQNRLDSHYLPLTDDQYQQARQKIESQS